MVSIKLPLVMHSSNLVFNYGLDNRHGGGGIETTDLNKDQTPRPEKKLKRDCSHSDMVSCKPHDSCQSSEYDERPGYEDSLVECEPSTSKASMDYLNSEQKAITEFNNLDELEHVGNDDSNDANLDPDTSKDGFDMDENAALFDSKLEELNALGPKNELVHEEEKVVLKGKEKNHFEVLPEGWTEVIHRSGMPIYLHKQSRVCSMSKPYFPGPGSLQKHNIPVSAIPCLHYLKGTEDTNKSTVANGIFPSTKLQSAKDTKESRSIDYLAVRKYCEKRFDFEKVIVRPISTGSGRRKQQRQMKRKRSPFLPENTKLITCPGAYENTAVSGTSIGKKGEFIMNPSGKSPMCILHNYVQHTLGVSPKYEFKEFENSITPFEAAVVINGNKYGNGYGKSKKLAKNAAATAALEILIPGMKLLPKEESSEKQAVEFFDQFRVEDPRVSDFSQKTGQPNPYQILLECLNRNYGMGDTEIEFSAKNINHMKNEFHMKVGKHSVSVICKNKRDGKYTASQAILQKLHPHISSWGSLLRMYGNGTYKTPQEKKEEERKITDLQRRTYSNTEILCKLKEDMLKYREKMMLKKPMGKLIPGRMEFLTTPQVPISII